MPSVSLLWHCHAAIVFCGSPDRAGARESVCTQTTIAIDKLNMSRFNVLHFVHSLTLSISNRQFGVANSFCHWFNLILVCAHTSTNKSILVSRVVDAAFLSLSLTHSLSITSPPWPLRLTFSFVGALFYRFRFNFVGKVSEKAREREQESESGARWRKKHKCTWDRHIQAMALLRRQFKVLLNKNFK